MPWLQLIASLVILGGVALALYPQVASWFSQKEQSRVNEMALESMEKAPNDDDVYRAQQLALAHEYNDALASGALYEANANIAVGDGTVADEALDYSSLLNVTDSGFMGRLKYDALSIDLPIYHGTDDATLERGIGHLEGTSLPVGGIGTRAVLTAHRGLPESTLFTNLDRAEIGDTFTISVYSQVLTYKVIEIQVIQPEETKAILADPDRDLVTLVTCTPLGINSHRILVTGERVTPTPESDIAEAAAVPELPGFPWWAVILGGTVGLIGLYLWRAGYQRVPDSLNRAIGNSPSRRGQP
ncbi:MAG: class C sortase [Ancrocorticia sp.]|jgi:sortase A|nr:class C sortase [Ancrocorticia sp.]